MFFLVSYCVVVVFEPVIVDIDMLLAGSVLPRSHSDTAIMSSPSCDSHMEDGLVNC